MTKIKKLVLSVILLLLAVTLCFSVSIKIAKAETVREDSAANGIKENTASPYGAYTKLKFGLSGGNGQVWAAVKNEFTLFPATVKVNVELYYSDTYQESYTDMTLVATKYIGDLDQGKTIKATASTNGKQGYWKMRAEYKIDSKAWQVKISDTMLFDADGYIIL